MNNEELISKFYQSFGEQNIEGMLACYHEEVVFEDPAFGVLKNGDPAQMWRMLLSRSTGNTTIECSNIKANETTGSANWRAAYEYGPKRRKVINEISAQFEFKDGKIIKHTDKFNLWKWTQQALGLPGYLLGWSPFMKKKINQMTNKLLTEFKKEQSS